MFTTRFKLGLMTLVAVCLSTPARALEDGFTYTDLTAFPINPLADGGPTKFQAITGDWMIQYTRSQFGASNPVDADGAHSVWISGMKVTHLAAPHAGEPALNVIVVPGLLTMNAGSFLGLANAKSSGPVLHGAIHTDHVVFKIEGVRSLDNPLKIFSWTMTVRGTHSDVPAPDGAACFGAQNVAGTYGPPGGNPTPPQIATWSDPVGWAVSPGDTFKVRLPSFGDDLATFEALNPILIVGREKREPPFDLAPRGAPGFELLVEPLAFIPGMPSMSGIDVAEVVFTLPNDPALPGEVFYFQWMIEDPGANPLGLTFSRGAEIWVVE